MPFETLDSGRPRKHVLGGVHTGATWRIPLLLNRPYAAAMRPVVKLLCVSLEGEAATVVPACSVCWRQR